MPKADKGSAIDELAELYLQTKGAAIRCGRALHDDAGPLLTAVGMHLQLLRTDHPELAGQLDPLSAILDQAFERIRAVSQELAASPVLRCGLKTALERLAEATAAEHPGASVKLDFRTAATVPPEAACALYDAAEAALAEAAGKFAATRIAITVKGIRDLSLRIADNGRARGRARALKTCRRIAEACGLFVTIATKKDTIVSIRYAVRRSASG